MQDNLLQKFRLPFLSRHLQKPLKHRAKPGAQPGTVVVNPESPKPRIRVIAYGPDAVDEQEITNVAELRSILGKRAVTWVNVDGLGDADTIHQLGDLFGLHPLVLEDIVHVHQRSKVEDFDDHLYIVVREVSYEDGLQTDQLSVILGDNFVLTLQEWQGDCFEPLRQRIRKGQGRIRQAGPDHLAYALIDAVVDSYFPVLEKYGEELERLDDQLGAGANARTIAKIHRLRSELFVLRKAIWPHRDTISELLRDTSERVTDETRVYLRDCYDHCVQIIDVTETLREMCSDLRDFQFAQVSIKQNEIMKVLTIVSTIFIPLSFVAGVYGMNFDPDTSPWNMPELRWYYGYPFALLLMTVIAALLFGFIWNRGWLGRESVVERRRRWRRRRKESTPLRPNDTL